MDFTYAEFETLFQSLDVFEDRINSIIDEYDVILNNPIVLRKENLQESDISQEEAKNIMVKRAKKNREEQIAYKEYLTLLKGKVIRLKDKAQIETLIDFKGNSDA